MMRDESVRRGRVRGGGRRKWNGWERSKGVRERRVRRGEARERGEGERRERGL